MKSNCLKSKLLIAVMILIGTTTAFGINHSIHLSSTNKKKVDMSIISAEKEGDKVKLAINYYAYGEEYEIGRDIIVAADEKFRNEAVDKRFSVDEVDKNTFYYEVTFGGEVSESIYIKPPILLLHENIDPVRGKVTEGSRFTAPDGSDWFSIVSCVITEDEKTGLFTVIIEIKPCGSELPRMPKLNIDGIEYGAVSGMSFDENFDFESGKFIFKGIDLMGNNKDDVIRKATLIIPKRLVRVEATDLSAAAEGIIVKVMGE